MSIFIQKSPKTVPEGSFTSLFVFISILRIIKWIRCDAVQKSNDKTILLFIYITALALKLQKHLALWDTIKIKISKHACGNCFCWIVLQTNKSYSSENSELPCWLEYLKGDTKVSVIVSGISISKQPYCLLYVLRTV